MVPRTRAQKQYAIIERGKFNLQRALDRLDYEEEVVLPGLEQIAELEKKGKVLEFNVNLDPLALPSGEES